MTRPPADVGTPVEEIDTPALVIDLDPYERNLDRMARALAGTPVRLRGHAKTHKCPVVALHQIARGAVGACCQKVSEAEAMLYGGVRNVLVSNQIVGARKIARLVGLAIPRIVFLRISALPVSRIPFMPNRSTVQCSTRTWFEPPTSPTITMPCV